MVSFFRLNTPFFQQVASTSITTTRRSPVTIALSTSFTTEAYDGAMSTNRREFFRRAAAFGVGLGVRAPALMAAQRPATMPTPRAAAFMKMFGLTYPISNAGMGSAAQPPLTIAVSTAGGLGSLGSGLSATADSIRTRVSRIRTATDRPFALNYLLPFQAPTLDVALEAGAPIIQFAFGIPAPDIVARIRKAGARFSVQVGSAEGARRAVDAGAAYLICQGIEAAGHVQSTTPLDDLLPAVVEEARDVPILAAGGIATGAHIRRALTAGASGVLMGTRFVATKEGHAHDDYKNALTRAKASDAVMTVCFQDGWVNAPHRVLRNRTLAMWEAAGCPPPGKRPGEGDVIATNTATGAKRIRYSLAPPYPEDRGAVLEMALYAGRGVDAIRDIPSAADLMARLWKECIDAT